MSRVTSGVTSGCPSLSPPIHVPKVTLGNLPEFRSLSTENPASLHASVKCVSSLFRTEGYISRR